MGGSKVMYSLSKAKFFMVTLAILLLISSLPVYPGGKAIAASIDPAIEESYVRIQNNYTGQYLLAMDDAVGYGNPVETDQASHWIIEESQGVQKIKNRLTNTYMSTANHKDYNTPVELSANGDANTSQWTIMNAVTNGYINIQSAANQDYFLHIEDGTGYAQASSIPADWGTVQWRIEPVIEYVRLKNSYTGDYLYALDGKVAYGNIVEENPSSHWIIDEDAGVQRIKNRDNGLYISMNNWQGNKSALELQALDIDSSKLDWNFMSAGANDVWNIKYALSSDQIIHIEDKTGYAQASDLPPNWGSGQWIIELVTTTKSYDPSPNDSPRYIRIKSDWLELYLYEEDGELHYGNALSSDQTSHWLVEEEGDYYRLKNRESGKYISLNGVMNDRMPVIVEDEIADDEVQLWQIDNMKTAGNKLIHAVNSDGQYLHLEKQLGFVQYGEIPADWGSPKWRFVNVTDDGPSYIRLKNEYTGQLLFEEDGKVKYGKPAFEDVSSHWLITDAGDGLYRIQNRASGHYIHIEGMQVGDNPHLLPLNVGVIEDSWTSAKWMVTDAGNNTINLTNAYQTNQLIHVQDATGYAQSSVIPADWGSAKWIKEAAPALLPITVPEQPVRLKNSATNEYIYENESGVVLYGSLNEADGRSHWVFQQDDEDASKYIFLNRATGHKVSSNMIEPFLTTIETAAITNHEQWWVEPAPDGIHALIRSVAYPKEYIHIKDRAGYAQQSLQSIESSDLYWELELAPSEMKEFVAEESNEPISTNLLAHQGIVQIIQNNAMLDLDNNELYWRTTNNQSVSSLWKIWDHNGYKLLQNNETEQFIIWNNNKLELVNINDIADQLPIHYYWQLTERNGLTFVKNASDPDQLIGPGKGEVTLNNVKMNVSIEAENSFLTGNIIASKNAKTYSGTGIIEGFDNAQDTMTFTVYAEEAGSYDATLIYANGSTNSKKLNVSVNGLANGQLQAVKGQNWDEWLELSYTLKLRRGLNTVTLESADQYKTPLLIDRTIVKQTIPTAYRGATTGYVVYEAEDQVTNGELLTEDRRYKQLASEASGREAVTLVNKDDYINFKINKPANVVTIRYAIPDSADGKGLNESFGLYVNGNKQGDTTLTSSFAWVYGSYPWTNQPSDGDAHRFYDEASFNIENASVGSTITIKKESAKETIPFLIVDLIETSLADDPYEMPNNFVSITDYGAIANDGIDDNAAIEKAIEAAKKKGYGVWIPSGQFNIEGGPIELADITIRGAGKWNTLIQGYGFIGNGNNIRIYDLAIDGQRDARKDELEESAFDGAFGKGSTIQHIRIDRTKTGIWSTRKEQSDGSFLQTDGLYVAGVQIRNTYADGINFSTGTQHSMAEHLSIRNTGDDGMAMWANEVQSTGNTFRFNTVELPWLSNNIAVYGGKDVQVTDNIVRDTVAFGAGISISTRHMPEPFEGTTIVARNTLERTGGREYNWSADFGGLFFFSSDKPMNSDILVYNNYIVDSTFQGISFLGEQFATGMVLDRNVVDGTGTWGIQTAGNISGSALIGNTVVRNARVGLLREGAAAFQLNKKDNAYNFQVNPYSIQLGQQIKAPFKVNVGQQEQVNLFPTGEVSASNKTFSARILDEKIATINAAGIITGKRYGTTQLVVEYGGVSRSYSLAVNDSEGPIWSDDSQITKIVNANGSLSLHWTPATDSSEQLSYRIIWENGYQIVNGKTETTIDKLTRGKSLTFTIEARDEAGNWSEQTLSTIVVIPSNAVDTTPSDSQINNQDTVTLSAGTYTRQDGTKVGKVTIDDELLLKVLRQLVANEKEPSQVTVNLNVNERAAELSISGAVIHKGLAISPEAILQIVHGNVTYSVSLFQLSQLVPNQTNASLIIKIEQLNEAGNQNIAIKTGITPIGFVYRINLELLEDGQSTKLDLHQSHYITRQFIYENTKDSVTLTAVIFDEKNNKFRYIPSQIRKLADGKMEVTMFSIVEGDFTLIETPITFTDINGHWAKNSIQRLATRQIVSGKSEDHYDPNGIVTRAQFIKLLTTGLGIPDNHEQSFNDVAAGSWYEGPIGAAFQAGILTGYGDNSVHPNETISREQLVAMLMRAYRYVTKDMNNAQHVPSQFTDYANVSQWALEDMSLAIELGFIQGKGQHLLSPKAEATRAEAAVIIERFLQAISFMDEN